MAGAVWLAALIGLTQSLPAQTLDSGWRALDQGRPAEAEEVFRRILLQAPDSNEALEGWARALVQQNRGLEALPAVLGAADRALGMAEYDDAAKAYGVAAGIDPEDPEIRSRLGHARVLDRRYLTAERDLMWAYERGQRDIATLIYFGAALWENGKPEEAERVYREAVARSDRAAAPLHQLGRLLLWSSSFVEAARVLTEAAGRGASGLDFELTRARALEGASTVDTEFTTEEALAAYLRAVELAPEHSEVRYGLARVLLRTGQRPQAAEQLDIYRRLQREDEERTREQGQLEARIANSLELLRQGDAEGALRGLDELPESVEGWRVAALAHRSLGHTERAMEALHRALALDPERTDLRSLLEEIAR